MEIYWRRLITYRLLLVLIIFIIGGSALRQATSSQPTETTTTTTATTTTTTTEPRYTSIGYYIVSAYSSYESCHNPQNNLCLMADGRPAETGAIACPRSFDLGTRFLINGQEYICRDRLSLRYDYRFDLFFGYGYENYIRAKEWGIRKLEVYIID
jgi:hypothetical protein